MGKGKNNANQGGGEQQKTEEKNETVNEEKKGGQNTAGSNKEAVLKVYIHCEGCATKVSNCLKGFDGVESVVIDNANRKVVVKGKNLDPMKVLGRLQKKFSRNVELLSPKPKPNEKKEPKKEEPKINTMVLKMYMHCEGCGNDIKKNLVRMKEIMSVELDMKKSTVLVRGVFDPQKLVGKISKRLGKHVEILKQEEEKGKANDQKKGKEKEDFCPYPPEYHVKYLYPSLVSLSDDNVFSCSIM